MTEPNNHELQEILNDFFLESAELIEKIDHDLLLLEKSPSSDLINRIFRSFHTLKGIASFLSFESLTKVSHHAEEVLNKLRKNELNISPSIIDSLLKASDVLKGLIADIKNKNTKCSQNISSIIQELTIVSSGQQKDESNSHQKIGELLIEDQLVSKEQIEDALLKQTKDPKIGEILINEGVISQEELKNTLKKQKQRPMTQTIRVEVTRLDSLMNLVGELVLSRNRLLRLNSEILEKYRADLLLEDLSETTAQLNQITSDLQSAIMKTRLITISKLFNQYPRMVRDLSREANKKINLLLSGEDTELDKSVIEEIHDPLIHLLRNSVDHGIESTKERTKKGKSPFGIISLSAYYEGNQVVIEIRDDGRGIDPDIIKKKAIEKGFVTKKDAEKMTPKDILQLTFIPGFSTAQSLTDISGRGVGMDVVRSNIQKLNGLITLDSQKGEGTKIFLKIPLTLAIIQVLIIKIGEELFALPLTFVHEVIHTQSISIRNVEQQEIVQFRGSIFPLVKPQNLFDIPLKKDGINGDDSRYIVITGVGEKKAALIIDTVIGQEELVIKSACNYANTPFIGGASIMGDGQVVFIIDVPSLIHHQFKNTGSELQLAAV